MSQRVSPSTTRWTTPSSGSATDASGSLSSACARETSGAQASASAQGSRLYRILFISGVSIVEERELRPRNGGRPAPRELVQESLEGGPGAAPIAEGEVGVALAQERHGDRISRGIAGDHPFEGLEGPSRIAARKPRLAQCEQRIVGEEIPGMRREKGLEAGDALVQPPGVEQGLRRLELPLVAEILAQRRVRGKRRRSIRAERARRRLVEVAAPDGNEGVGVLVLFHDRRRLRCNRSEPHHLELLGEDVGGGARSSFHRLPLREQSHLPLQRAQPALAAGDGELQLSELLVQAIEIALGGGLLPRAAGEQQRQEETGMDELVRHVEIPRRKRRFRGRMLGLPLLGSQES